MEQLSLHQKEILKQLYPNKVIDDNEFKSKFDIPWDDKSCTRLFTLRYMSRDTSRLNMPGIISLSESGRAYVEELKAIDIDKQQTNIRFIIPTIISLAALLRPEITVLIKHIINLCTQK